MSLLTIDRIELHHIALPLVHPFETSMGAERVRPVILTAVYADGLVGYGECVAMSGPWYTSETVETAWHILTSYLAPALRGWQVDVHDPGRVPPLWARVRGHQMALAGLECALWDLAAKAQGIPLSQLLGGTQTRVAVGVSLGIEPSIEALLAQVDKFVQEGYRRVKLKIKPGWAVEPVRAVRLAYPDLPLMADANSAFTLADVPLLQGLDELDLLMIEQPLAWHDIADHAQLQKQLRTPICLDESIQRPEDAALAVALGACRVINVKVGRVGGLGAVLKIHAIAQEAGLDLWCGGMLEAGVGRATNVHLASLPGFTLPGDISASDRYYRAEVVKPSFVLNREDSTLTVPLEPGLGVAVDWEVVRGVGVNRVEI
jgi:o-succinylbenzoate synthase